MNDLLVSSILWHSRPLIISSVKGWYKIQWFKKETKLMSSHNFGYNALIIDIKKDSITVCKLILCIYTTVSGRNQPFKLATFQLSKELASMYLPNVELNCQDYVWALRWLTLPLPWCILEPWYLLKRDSQGVEVDFRQGDRVSFTMASIYSLPVSFFRTLARVISGAFINSLLLLLRPLPFPYISGSFLPQQLFHLSIISFSFYL